MSILQKLPYNIYSRLVYYSNENQLYFIPVFIYTYIKVKLAEGEKRWLRQSRTEPYLPIFSFGCKRIRNPNSKAKQDSPLIKPQKPTPKSVNPSSSLQPELAKLSPICLIFANRRFRSKREPFSSFSLRLKTN